MKKYYMLWFTTDFYLYLFHPLDQFEIYILFKYWPQLGIHNGISLLTNLTFFFIFSAFIIRFGLTFQNYITILIIPKLVVRSFYRTVRDITRKNLPLKRNQYYPALFFLFLFILTANFIGLIPYSFTTTSSFIITFFLALSYFIGINIILIFQNKWKSLRIFLPNNIPIVIIPFLVFIEFLSYIAKVFSLSIRLFANMMAGHALLKILIGFAWGLCTIKHFFIIISVLPWIVVTILFFLETLIAHLQAYVFTMLVTIYINDVLNFH